MPMNSARTLFGLMWRRDEYIRNYEAIATSAVKSWGACRDGDVLTFPDGSRLEIRTSASEVWADGSPVRMLVPV